MTNLKPGPQALAFNAIAAMLGIAPRESFDVAPADDNFAPGRVLAFNASQFTVNAPSEFLTNYAVRYSDPNQQLLQGLREQIAPEVMSNSSAFVQYPVFGFTDAFLALDNPLDVRRGIGADFTTVGNVTHNLATQKMPEIGLAVEVDEEEELLDPDWQQRKVAWLLGILDRSELRQCLALLVAGATNVAKTWDSSAGKDPDQDIATELNAMQITPNNVWIGPGAWIKRLLSLRSQNLAGQGVSSTMTAEQLGGMWNANVQVPRPRYASGAGVTSQIFGSVVMMFTAFPGMSRDDFSNLKTFTAPARNGQRRAVWVRKVGDARWRIAVSTGKRLVALTSAIGLETITVS
jgi:phage terminase large subunit-like protein